MSIWEYVKVGHMFGITGLVASSRSGTVRRLTSHAIIADPRGLIACRSALMTARPSVRSLVPRTKPRTGSMKSGVSYACGVCR